VIEKIEDVDQLEKLLKEVPLNEYALRKAIRLQIRQLKVKQGKSIVMIAFLKRCRYGSDWTWLDLICLSTISLCKQHTGNIGR